MSDLSELLSQKYRVRRMPRDQQRAVGWEIPCDHDISIRPLYDDFLMLVVKDGHPKIIERCRRVPYTEIVARGDGWTALSFPAEVTDEIARLVHPHVGRKMSPERRQRNAELLAKARRQRKAGEAKLPVERN